MDDLRDQEALENDVNQVEEAGDTELDHFTGSSEDMSKDSEADLDLDTDVVMELVRIEDGRSDYEESEESDDGVIVVEDRDEDLEDNMKRSIGSSSVDTVDDQPPLRDESVSLVLVLQSANRIGSQSGNLLHQGTRQLHQAPNSQVNRQTSYRTPS